MTGTPLERLRALGFDERDASTRGQLIERVVAEHGTWSGRPAWCWFVPGRIEIFGKHTDYAGGRSLLAAAPRGFAVAAGPRVGSRVSVRDAHSGETTVMAAGEVRPAAVSGLTYMMAVVRRFESNFPGAPLGADLTIASDLPRAAGLSSSSALVVAVAMALIRRANLEDRPEWRTSIRTPHDLAGYLGAVERGAAFGELEGTPGVGTFGGSEDHTAILTCRAGLVSACGFVPVVALGEAPMPARWRFVVATTGIQADKTGGARERYNRASLAAAALVRLWNEATGESRGTLAGIVASSPAASVEMEALAAGSRIDGLAPELLCRRLRHFIAEDGRVPEALRAFRAADAHAIGLLARASQSDAETLLQNQTPETSDLAALAIDCGAFAASSFGAGFGGSVWALVPADEAESFGERWLGKYRRRHAAGRPPSWFVARPGPGAFQWL